MSIGPVVRTVSMIGCIVLLTSVFPGQSRAQRLALECPFALVAGSRYPTGEQPFDILTEDFNGDGILDAAVANVYSNDVTMYRGIGDGGFAQHIPLSAGEHPAALALGDLNGDGFGDLLVGNVGKSAISVFLGSATGAFTPAEPIVPGGAPLAIRARDVTDDGIVDIVVTDASFDRLYVLEGEEDGGYRELERHEIGSLPFDLVLKDVTRDGRLDAVILSFDGNSVEVLPGAKSGGIFDSDRQESFLVSERPRVFLEEMNVEIAPYPIDFDLADFNGDGLTDVATANYGTKDIGVLLGDPETVFGAPLNLALDEFPSAIVARDMNGDSLLDLVVSSAGANRIFVFLGTGDGSFEQNVFVYEVDLAPSALAVADFDQDGRPDIGVTTFEESTLQIFLNQSEGGVGCFPSRIREQEQAVCGDGVLEQEEECDDANSRDGDGCSSECLLEIGFCGDGTIQKLLNEQCEPRLHDPKLPYTCTDKCRTLSPLCGNGRSDAGEECDDGARNSDDPDAACRSDCSLPRCGDGILDAPEECDDGNRFSRDGCDVSCQLELPAAGERFESATSSSVSSVGSTPFQRLPYAFGQLPPGIPFSALQGQLPFMTVPLVPSQPDTGPATAAVMAAGAAAGLAWMRRKKNK